MRPGVPRCFTRAPEKHIWRDCWLALTIIVKGSWRESLSRAGNPSRGLPYILCTTGRPHASPGHPGNSTRETPRAGLLPDLGYYLSAPTQQVAGHSRSPSRSLAYNLCEPRAPRYLTRAPEKLPLWGCWLTRTIIVQSSGRESPSRACGPSRSLSYAPRARRGPQMAHPGTQEPPLGRLLTGRDYYRAARCTHVAEQCRSPSSSCPYVLCAPRGPDASPGHLRDKSGGIAGLQ